MAPQVICFITTPVIIMAVTKPPILTPEKNLAMSLKAHFRSAFDWTYALILAPFLATHLIFDIVLITLFPFARQSKEWNLNQALVVALGLWADDLESVTLFSGFESEAVSCTHERHEEED